MKRSGDSWWYGLMVSTAYWVLIVVTVMLLSEYDRHDLVLLLLIGVFVAGGGTLLVGGIDLRERRYAVRPGGGAGRARRGLRIRRGDTVCGRVSSCWRWSFLSKG